MASKSIRDRLLTGSRIPLSKRATALFFFAENLPATEVAKIVGISLDSARGIRDREQNLIMVLKKTNGRSVLPTLGTGHHRVRLELVRLDYSAEVVQHADLCPVRA